MQIVMPVEAPLAGLLIDFTSGAVAMLAGLSGLLGGTAHYLAVLAERSHGEVEVRTGAGFFAGMFIGASLLLADVIV